MQTGSLLFLMKRTAPSPSRSKEAMIAVGFSPRTLNETALVAERRLKDGPLDGRTVQLSLHDAGRWFRLFRGLKRHGYLHEVAPRLSRELTFRWDSWERRGRGIVVAAASQGKPSSVRAASSENRPHLTSFLAGNSWF